VSGKKLSRAKRIQYKQWLAANPEIAKNAPEPIKSEKGVGRNDPCPCNSGLKFKKCCLSQ
jgi:uncharacterized protein YecA (UPF0149 family)